MITVIVFAILGVILGLWFLGEEEPGTGVMLGAFLGGLAGLLASIILGGFFAQYEPFESKVNIEVLNDGATVETLRRGWVQGEDVFRFYVREDDGGLDLRSLDADVSKVYDDTENNAYVMTYCDKRVSNNSLFIQASAEWRDCYYHFHVPSDSISSDPQITLDGE